MGYSDAEGDILEDIEDAKARQSIMLQETPNSGWDTESKLLLEGTVDKCTPLMLRGRPNSLFY